jgi:transcriptional regulator GlxA family with amidase domain
MSSDALDHLTIQLGSVKKSVPLQFASPVLNSFRTTNWDTLPMRRTGFVVMPGFQVMSFAALTAFECANLVLGTPFYGLHVLSEAGGPIRSSFGMTIDTMPIYDGRFDTIIVGGELYVRSSSAGLLARLQDASGISRRIGSICTGAFVLAEAGLLDDRRATTHWAYARELQNNHPKVQVEMDRIFIVDGNVWTSAGMSAGVDLALGMIEEDLGRDLARKVAKRLVLSHRRSGGQSQHSTLLDLEPKSDRIQRTLIYAKENLGKLLSVADLAQVACLSPRQFTRAFTAETGHSPAKAIEMLRIEAARTMMEDGNYSISTVAAATGFAGRERMRRAFLRAFGQPPQTMQRI